MTINFEADSTLKKFTGGIYIDQSDPVRESGEIIIQETLIIFSNQNREVRFSIDNLNIRFGGTAKRIAYLSDMARSGTTLHITDFEILKHEAFAGHAAARNVLGERKKHHSSLVFVFLALAALVLIPSYLVFIERTILAGIIADRVPIEAEETLGDYVFDLQFGSKDAFITDPEIVEGLNILMAPLLDAVKDSGYNFRVHIMKDETANAFALPGGNIIVLTGLIEQSERPEELLGVLAHEMAHVTRRHSLKQMISEFSGYVLLNIIASGAGDLVFAVGDNARALLSKEFSRRQEQDADEVGFEYLMKAGISPKGLITFFEKLQEEEAITDTKLLTLISTHPASEDRIDNLNQMLGESRYQFEAIEFSYEDFKQKIAERSGFKNTEITDETDN